MSHGINVAPQELASAPVELIMHEDPVQPRNDDEGSVPYSPFMYMMPKGARGFRSPKRLVEQFAIPPILKFVDTTKVGPETTELEQLEVHQEDIVPYQNT